MFKKGDSKIMISLKKKALSVLTSFVMAAAFALPIVSGAESSDGIMMKITKEKQVVDTMSYGGKTYEAIYHPIYNIPYSEVFSDETYCCAALVSRFYKSAFGIETTYMIPGEYPQASNAQFVETDNPKVGDIYGSYNHWAIVKDVSKTTITLFEQNWCWLGGDDGKTTFAQYNRKVDAKELDNSERFFTVKGAAVHSNSVQAVEKISVGLKSIVKNAFRLVFNKANVDGYKVYMSENANFKESKVVRNEGADNTTVRFDGLKAAKKYYLKIYGFRYITKDGKTTEILSEPTYLEIMTYGETPNVPLTYANTTTSAMRIQLKRTDASVYKVWICADKSFSDKKTRYKRLEGNANIETRFDNLSLKSGKYYVKTQGCKKINGKWYYSLPTVTEITLAPTLYNTKVNTIATSENAVRVELEKNISADGYKIWICKDLSFDSSKTRLIRTSSNAKTSNRFDSLSLKHHTYKLKVQTYAWHDNGVRTQVVYSKEDVYDANLK